MIGWIVIGVVLIIGLSGIRLIRPTERGLIERLGKYRGYGKQGFNWIIPIIDRMIVVNITERMADVRPQDIITKDNLNAKVDLIVYYKVKADEENVRRSVYNVDDFRTQIISLAQTTARNVIGDMIFRDVNNKRNTLNKELAKVLDKESDAWGVQIVRVELKEITPPSDVQETMNKVIKAENEKVAAVDFATSKETEADGIRRAKIKEADGRAEGIKIVARGKAEAIKLVHESANRYFKGNAQQLKKYEVIDNFKENSKIIIGDSGEGILKHFDINSIGKKK